MTLPIPACHSPGGPTAATPSARQVALLGMPNTGKSTLFNRLTGGDAQIANWPGLTVELVDLPGIHDFRGSSEDEAIVQRFLRATPPDLVVVVLNASQVVAQLRLLLQVRALGLPTLVALNMSDEARRWGVRIDSAGLARRLELPVVPISALRREGIGSLLAAIHTVAASPPPSPASPAPADPAALEALRLELAAACVRQPAHAPNRHSRRVDRLLLHPLVGPLLFLLIVAVMFQAIYSLGAPLQGGLGLLLDAVRQRLLEPLLQGVGAPPLLRGFLLDGI